MLSRKPGGQPGNENAMKHGRFSVKKRAERRAKRQVIDAERQRQHAEWMAKMPKTDYGRICAKIASAGSGFEKRSLQ